MLRRAAVVLALPFALTPLNAALAQTVLPVNSPARLGDFLVAHAKSLSGQYDAALAWYSHQQLARQQQAKNILLQNIAALANFDRIHAKRYAGLFRLVESMHATGRVPLPQTDPRYMQAHPELTPVLAPGDSVVIPERPTTVTVVRSDGSVCPIRFSPGVDALVYIRACDPSASPDTVWVAQPTGQIQTNGSGIWNAQTQDPPAPGAWIWAPGPDSGWPKRISEQLVQFLATQPPLEQQQTIEAKAARSSTKAQAPQAHSAPEQVASASPQGIAASTQRPHAAQAPATEVAQAPASPKSPQTVPAPVVASAQRPQRETSTQTQSTPPAPTPIPTPGIGPRNWTVAKAAGSNAAPPAPPAPRTLTVAQQTAVPLHGFDLSVDDWGEPGVLQTPSARMYPAGTAIASISHVFPYSRLNFMFQPLSWLEFGFRYTDILNQAYGPASLSGNQSYKDKSADLKLRLHQETHYWPELSLGFQDVAGTGLFSSEYLVGSKRFGNFDVSAGLAWGYLGGRQDLKNPLSLLSKSFNTRVNSSSPTGGSFSFKSYFHGRTAPFVGVQYDTPINGLTLKAEYDPNNYKNEPFGEVLPQRSPFNVGAVYHVNRNVDVAVGLERGNTLQTELTLHGNLARLSQPKFGYPNEEPLQTAYVQQSVATGTLHLAPKNDSALVASILQNESAWPKTLAKRIDAECLCHVGQLRALPTNNALYVRIDNPDAYELQPLVERITRVLVLHAPEEYRHFSIVFTRWGTVEQSLLVDRRLWLINHTRYLPPGSRLPDTVVAAPPRLDDLEASPPLLTQSASPFHVSFGPGYQQTMGGPNGFILYQLSANLFSTYKFSPDTWIAGDINYGLLNNYSHFTYDAPSNLPRVRTDIRQYVTTSRLTMPLLQITHIGRLSSDTYYSLYAGALESMFAGVGGEVLYRPWNSNFAWGADLNEVRQRGFNQHFSLLPYHVLTGHATMYWKTGIDGVLAKISAGKYLAGDKGVTIDLSRAFANGVRIGAYATKTNVSAAQFGEGSFDKGIYLDIPFDLMLTRSTDQVAHILWQPLLRDGGANLDRKYKLYDLTSDGELELPNRK